MIAVRDGLRLRVDDRGEGPAALLVHGFTGSADAWGDEVLDGLVESGRRVIAVDLPGHGRSEVLGEPEGMTMERVVGDLVDVLDALALERADWIGYSMGGRISLGAAALQPSRVRRLVLEGASPGLATKEEREERRRRDEELASRIVDTEIEDFVDYWMDLPLFETQKRLPEIRRRKARERRLRCSPEGLAATLRGLGTGHQPSFWDVLDEMSMPVLLLTGEADPKFTRIAARMDELLPRATRAAVPCAGHTVHFETPALWLRHVTEFLDRPTRDERRPERDAPKPPDDDSRS